MTLLEIKNLDDKTLMQKLAKELHVNNLIELAAKVEVPYNTMTKWKCEKGIPTELPDRGAYRQLFQSLLFIEQEQTELKDYREYFKLQAALQKKYLKVK